MDNKILGKFTTSTVKLLSNARSPHCQKTHTEKKQSRNGSIDCNPHNHWNLTSSRFRKQYCFHRKMQAILNLEMTKITISITANPHSTK